MVVGFTAFALIVYNGIIDQPGTETSRSPSPRGYYVGLLAAAGIAGRRQRQSHGER